MDEVGRHGIPPLQAVGDVVAGKLLSYVSELAMRQGCILPKQYELIAKQIYDAENMLGAWMNSDRRRFGTANPAHAANTPSTSNAATARGR